MRYMRKVAAGCVILICLYIGSMPFILARAMRDTWDAKLVLNEFYVQVQAHNYQRARQLLTRKLQADVSVQSLRQQWKPFEQAHGAIKNWVPAAGGTASGQASVLPRFVDFNHKVTGAKGGAGTVFVRMVPESGTWRVTWLVVQP